MLAIITVEFVYFASWRVIGVLNPPRHPAFRLKIPRWFHGIRENSAIVSTRDHRSALKTLSSLSSPPPLVPLTRRRSSTHHRTLSDLNSASAPFRLRCADRGASSHTGAAVSAAIVGPRVGGALRAAVVVRERMRARILEKDASVYTADTAMPPFFYERAALEERSDEEMEEFCDHGASNLAHPEGQPRGGIFF